MKNYRIVKTTTRDGSLVGDYVFCCVSNLRTAKAILKELYEIVSSRGSCTQLNWQRSGWRFTYYPGWGTDDTIVEIQEGDQFSSVREFRESGLYFVP